MATNTSTANANCIQQIKLLPRTLLRGAGQVMFQNNAWTGLFFLLGIFWGSFQTHNPEVAWGALTALVVSTLSGYLVGENQKDGDDGLWAFNGILVGCAFPTFLGNTWLMWISLVFFSMASTWVRTGMNNAIASWKISSFTFPFVFLTWIFLFCAHMLGAIEPTGLSTPTVHEVAVPWTFHADFGDLVIYWLKGVSQVFLVDSWVTGIFFLVGLALCSFWAAFYAALASAIALGLAIVFQANPADIASGLYGFSPVLTGIALGMAFFKPGWRTGLWAVAGIIATFFIQVAMDVFMDPWGIPTLTGPFCVGTWLFMLPWYKFKH